MTLKPAPVTVMGVAGIMTTGAAGGRESSLIVGTSAGEDSTLATSALARKSFAVSCVSTVLMLNAVAPPVSCCCATIASAPSTTPLLLASL